MLTRVRGIDVSPSRTESDGLEPVIWGEYDDGAETLAVASLAIILDNAASLCWSSPGAPRHGSRRGVESVKASSTKLPSLGLCVPTTLLRERDATVLHSLPTVVNLWYYMITLEDIGLAAGGGTTASMGHELLRRWMGSSRRPRDVARLDRFVAVV
jgi:hypothetical protein